MKLEFEECESCSAKPGSPTLCKGCLHNREVIEALTRFYGLAADKFCEAYDLLQKLVADVKRGDVRPPEG